MVYYDSKIKIIWEIIHMYTFFFVNNKSKFLNHIASYSNYNSLNKKMFLIFILLFFSILLSLIFICFCFFTFYIFHLMSYLENEREGHS
jgi:flagellar biosynthesis protein FlhB